MFATGLHFLWRRSPRCFFLLSFFYCHSGLVSESMNLVWQITINCHPELVSGSVPPSIRGSTGSPTVVRLCRWKLRCEATTANIYRFRIHIRSKCVRVWRRSLRWLFYCHSERYATTIRTYFGRVFRNL